jgi:hypothetical protein
MEAAGTHLYTWQMNVGDEYGDRGVTIETGTEHDRPYFLLRGGNEGYVKGWVLYPERIMIDESDPLRIAAGGVDTRMFVAMVVDSGPVQEASIGGEGMESRLEVGDEVVWYDPAADRVVIASTTGLAARRTGRAGARWSGVQRASYRPSLRRVAFTVTAGSNTPSIVIYNARGMRVRRLSAPPGPGPHAMVWDCRNDRGERVGAGSYLLVCSDGAAGNGTRVVVH